MFVHVLDWPDPALTIPSFGARVTAARMLATGEPIEVTQSDAGITLRLPGSSQSEIDRVVVLETASGSSQRF